MMIGWLRDFRFAWRVLARRPGYTLAAVLALGLGVGATTAIFSVFDAVLLRPLPYPEAERLVRVWETNPGKGLEHNDVSPVLYADLVDQATSFAKLAGWWRPERNLTSGEGEPQRVRIVDVTDSFFDVLGVPTQLGRGFAPGEDDRGRDPLVVIGHDLWQRRFGGDSQVLEARILLDGSPHSVIGVAAPGFDYPDGTEVWRTLGWDPAGHSRRARFFGVAARLAPGVSLGAAQAELDSMTEKIARENPNTSEGWSAQLISVHDDLVGEVRPVLRLLLGAVALVLLIACANVANLLLAQASTRTREVAVRSALGAGRRRLIRQFLTESLTLALVGALLGLGLAYAGVALLPLLAPDGLPRVEEVTLNGRVLAFTLGVALLCGLFFGLAPAWQGGRPRNDALKEGTRGGSAGMGSRRLRGALVVAELALAMMLLLGAGLLVRSFYQLLAEDPGFAPERLIAFNLQLPRSQYGDWSEVTAFYERLVSGIESVGGVNGAAATSFLPFQEGWPIEFTIPGRDPNREQPRAQYHQVSPGYFQVMGIPLLKGRDFTTRDTATAKPVVIVNRAAARRFWPDEEALDQVFTGGTSRIGPLGQALTESLDVEVVGVVGDVKNQSLERAAEPALYFPQTQFAYRSMHVLARTQGEPTALAAAIKTKLWELDPQLPVADLRTLEAYMSTALARRRFAMLLLATFAGLALLLAWIGIYGVLSYTASQRRREIGIRVALGARRSDVVSLVIRQGIALAGVGIGLGVLGAVVFRRVMASLVYGVGTADVLTFIAVTALLASAVLLACYLPARRAATMNPVVALRSE